MSPLPEVLGFTWNDSKCTVYQSLTVQVFRKEAPENMVLVLVLRLNDYENILRQLSLLIFQFQVLSVGKIKISETK